MSHKKVFLPWFSTSGREKARARAKAKKFAGIAVRVITTADVAPSTSKTAERRQCHGKASKTQE